jgi:recombination protein RecA
MTTTKQQSIVQVVTAIQQRWGEKALHRLAQIKTDTDGIPTGYAAFDRLLGRNGVPRGIPICLSGRPTSGMTTLALDVLARAQADGEVTVYIDSGRTLDPAYVTQRGINLERLLLVWPQPRELGLEIARDIAAGGGAGVVVFDLGNTSPGDLAQPDQVTWTLRQLIMTLARSSYTLISLSAASDHLNAAVISYASVHLHVERLRWFHHAGRVDGYEVRVTALKNKYAPPGQTVTFVISLDAAEQRQRP